MDTTVIIVSHNTRELTLACLRSLYAHPSRSGFEVIVVDNASVDGSAQAFATEFPQMRLLAELHNHGFGAANNLAAEHAAGECLLLLNPDTVVLGGAIEKLRAFAESHPKASILGGRTLFVDGSLNPKSCWRRPTAWSAFCIGSGLSLLFPKSSLFAPESFGAWKRDTVREVDIISGCFLLIKKSLWEELGGFDPAFFMYGEEADLCLRAAKLGHKCMICPDATIIHYGGASEKVRADKMVRLFKAKALLFQRHWPAHWLPFGIFCLDLWALTRMIAFGLLRFLRPRHRESYKTWRDIWSHRQEWRVRPESREAASVPAGATANA